ncbi:MAG: hypothetical protein LH624_12615 [Cryobacterium sp.]|nr:hypothetical protein [Cryobacterium sp.]
MTEIDIQITAPMRSPLVSKPWGSEEHFAVTEHYVGKILRVKAGHCLSLQYHEEKDETIALIYGQGFIYVGPDPEHLTRYALRQGENIRIRPGVVHRVEALLDAVLLEASTTQLDDVVRLTDNYGREGTSAP